MVHRRSPAAREARRQRAIARGYACPQLCEPGHRFVRVPTDMVQRAKHMLRSLVIHDKHDDANGRHAHYARDAARRALDDPLQREAALAVHRRANAAKHNGASRPRLGASGDDSVDHLQADAPISGSEYGSGDDPDHEFDEEDEFVGADEEDEFS